mgnify:CR=1 FL=1|jgi:hypothetical protein|tara:strand:+ start:1134 stop:1622 length:489 start_codon:yes stop_codon:yes gene_type:complete
MIREKIDNNIWIYRIAGLLCVLFFLLILTNPLWADTITFKFKNPSFSGINTSSHYLTIENQEFNRKEALKAEIKALQDEIERDKENTTLARFIRNLESRIYAQLSRQLVENLFGETPSTEGTLSLEGNTIEYSVVDGIITLTITDSDGNVTTISLPIGNFTF